MFFNFKIGYGKVIVLMIDVDNFKSVNDNFGYKIGDILLKEFVILFIYFFVDDFIVRYGGEEFIVILVGVSKFFFMFLLEFMDVVCFI